ncbi:MAG: anhydro-N-acetylmuramic acid kinase [Planctomycetota bacterium]
MRFLGLMSGTSCDGLSMALVDAGRGRPRVLEHASVAWPAKFRRRLLALPGATAAEICEANMAIGEAFGKAARGLAKKADVIGSHGQTVWHVPGKASLQVGEPSVIAALTGKPVVADFRPADIAAGGQGAPLVPFADRLFFANPKHDVAVLNIGGIANVTWLGRDGRVAAFDTGPGNCLLDAAARRFIKKPYDRDGATARKGKVDFHLLEKWLAHPWFEVQPPKSTGRELFSDDWVPAHGKAADILATLTCLTSMTLASQTLACGRPAEILVGGGGWRNRFLIEGLETLFGVLLRPTDDHGVNSDAREAAAFALLAWAFVKRIPANIATGGRPAVLGRLSLPS